MIVLAGFGLSILVVLVVLLWIFVPALYGLPLVPTKPQRIRHALQLANLKPGETLYDLGAGDGRTRPRSTSSSADSEPSARPSRSGTSPSCSEFSWRKNERSRTARRPG